MTTIGIIDAGAIRSAFAAALAGLPDFAKRL